MKATLALSLTSTQLLAEVLRPAAAAGLRGILRSLPFVGAQAGGAPREVAARAALSGTFTADVLRPQLEQAMEQLQAVHSGPLSGLDLEVQLGLDHARIGLMMLGDVSATALSSDARETYARAWVKQMLHLDPETQLVRWQILADAHKLLISCVDRRVFEVLSDFALQHRLRFASCRPAVLSAVSPEREAPAGLTVVWTEAGAGASRSGSVQLLRFEGNQLSSAWRGWAPCASADGNDDALEGAVRRFHARNNASAAEIVRRLHWPSTAQDTTRLT